MKFIKYTDAYYDYIQQYVLTDDQLLYTISPEDAVAELNDEKRAILAFDDDLFVTFFVLHEGTGPQQFMGSPNAILLRSFSTDNRFQGKGYAKKALQLVPTYIQENYSQVDTIVLAVNIENNHAQSLYLKSGYEDAGKRMIGRRGELIILEYKL